VDVRKITSGQKVLEGFFGNRRCRLAWFGWGSRRCVAFGLYVPEIGVRSVKAGEDPRQRQDDRRQKHQKLEVRAAKLAAGAHSLAPFQLRLEGSPAFTFRDQWLGFAFEYHQTNQQAKRAVELWLALGCIESKAFVRPEPEYFAPL
jgi:hypothetical protein